MKRYDYIILFCAIARFARIELEAVLITEIIDIGDDWHDWINDERNHRVPQPKRL